MSDYILYSLKGNNLIAIAAITLAEALQQNKSLEELKWVIRWLM